MTGWQAEIDRAVAGMDMHDLGNGQHALVKRASRRETVRILAFHGGGGVDGTPGMLAPFLDLLWPEGNVTVAAASYRTLNRNGADLDEMLADAGTALEWCRSDMPAGSRLFVLGASFGGLLALHATMEAPTGIEGLILLNPVTNIAAGGFANRVVPAEGRAELSPLQRYARHPLLQGLRCFVAHGERDEVVPIAASRDFALLWPPGRVKFAAFPNSSHGFFNRKPHSARVAAMVLDFIATEAAEAPPAAPVSRLPEGAVMLYGIGAQKAGTSWLFDFLNGHPDCHCTETKEMHYFDVLHSPNEVGHLGGRIDLMKSLCDRLSRTPKPGNQGFLDRIDRVTRQLRMYSGVPGDHGPYLDYLSHGYAGQSVIVDITPSYATLDRLAFADMDSVGPAKFLFILRDPVDRIWSQIRMLIKDKGIAPGTADYAAACIEQSRHMNRTSRLADLPRADYARTISELERVIPRDRIHYAFYETMFTQAGVTRICAFLGIADKAAETDRRVGTGSEVDMPDEVRDLLLDGLRPQYEAAFEKFGAAVPEHWHRFDGITPVKHGSGLTGLVRRSLGRG